MIISLLTVMDINIWSKNDKNLDNEEDKNKIMIYKIIGIHWLLFFYYYIFLQFIILVCLATTIS